MNTEPFVGREAALTEVGRLLADADAGTGGLLLIGGPAGIGKTRLCEEATAKAAAPVRWGRCVDDPGAPPLWPWRRILDGVPEPEPGADPVAAGFRFVADAADSLVGAASADGLVLVLEDLHWADDASLRLLRHLAGELRRSRLAVLATYRDTEPALDDLLRRPGTHGRTLAPLTAPDVRQFLAHQGPVTDGEVRDALRRSGGNPLYLRAIVRSATGDGRDGLGHLVRTTVATLDRRIRELLAIAAVLGEDVDGEVLAEVSEMDGDTVAAGLDQAVRAGVLVPVGAGLRRFAHAVVRDGVYADLAPSVRESLHARAATVLEDRALRDPALAGVVAGHWLRAATGRPALSRAAEWASRAAEEASRTYAFAEAARFLTFAVDAWRRAGEPDRVPGLLVRLATAEYRSGRFRQSFEHAREAAGLGDPAVVVAAALVVKDIAAPDLLPGMAELTTTALALAGDAEPAVRAKLLAQSASVAAEAGRIHEAREKAAQALELAEASGDPEALVDAVRARFKGWPIELPMPERLRLAALAIELGLGTGQPLLALWGHKWRLDAAFEVGTMAVVDEELGAIAELARTTRLPLVRWHELRLRASVLAYRGSFAEAREVNAQASELATAELADDFSAAAMSAAFGQQLVGVTGDPGDIPGDMPQLLTLSPTLAVAAVAYPHAMLLHGKRDEAAAGYEAVRPRAGEAGFLDQNPAVSLILLPLAEVFGDRETTGLLARHYGDWPHFVSGGTGVYCSDTLPSWRARAAALLGQYDDAVRWFEEAIAIDSRTGARPYVALNRLALAEVLMACDDFARAETLARQAMEEARRLGMPGPARRASGVLERLRTADPLTAREREIAGLLAESLSNRQIADRLVLSERTVESHVRSILAKLGLANRVEVAQWARGKRDA
ncbi:AAA family ATPase [Amycolatopsis sp. GM8]|uniref:ATP-binding protein n=1 Tax=Amycolatopsis sp. GM8 TaxID=2896530 RepID=UPI001EFFC2EB|nr:LuxR family transcriptional regulator [Amycolatopsis sp. GM8]